MIKLSGPSSLIEAEAKRKILSPKDIKKIIQQNNKKELQRTKSNILETLQFYDRTIKSINTTIKQIEKSNADYITKKNKIQQQQKELHIAKKEKHIYQKLLKEIENINK